MAFVAFGDTFKVVTFMHFEILKIRQTMNFATFCHDHRNPTYSTKRKRLLKKHCFLKAYGLFFLLGIRNGAF